MEKNYSRNLTAVINISRSAYGIISTMKQLLYTLIFGGMLFAATPEQVDRYLSVSNADEQLLELESQFSQMQENINRISTENDPESYDMQMLPIRFKAYLQKNISEDEMEQILKLYKNVILLQFVSATVDEMPDAKTVEAYVKTLKSDPESGTRIDLVKKITSQMYDKSSMALMFDKLIKPLMLNAPGGDRLDPKVLEKSRDIYLKRMVKETQDEVLYATRDFTMDELEKLEKISHEPAISIETKAVFGATAYALEAFFLSLSKRYDISKHQSTQKAAQ